MKPLLLFSILLIFCNFVLITPSPATGGPSYQTSTLNVSFADSAGNPYCLMVTPEPEKSSIIITFVVDGHTPVRIGLYNIIGQQTRQWEAANIEAGTHRIEITHLAPSSGIYFIVFETGSYRVIRKVLYVRQ